MTSNSAPVILAGNSSGDFAYSMTNHSLTQGKEMIFGLVTHKQFPSGEWHCKIEGNIRGRDVYLVQTGAFPANENLMQLLIMADAARRASAERITVVTPCFFYQRQDRKEQSRVPISSKLVLDLFEAAGVNRVLTMDLHAGQIQGMTSKLKFDQIHFLPCLIEAIKDLGIQTLVSPDEGAVKRTSYAASKLGADRAIIFKNRKSDTEVEAISFVGDVKDKNVLILDDITESAGTIVQAAKICKENGAAKVYGAVTHAAITMVGHDRLYQAIYEQKILDGFYFSNTIQHDIKRAPQVNVVDVSRLFAEAINSIHNNESISSLFV
jgi:ribose-phosphate pyrophosphokinase